MLLLPRPCKPQCREAEAACNCKHLTAVVPRPLPPAPCRRYLPDNSYEDWSLSELIIPER